MVDIITKKLAQTLLPKREQVSNKATFGKVLNISGSKCFPGAAYLSSYSALKTGCGYLTLATIESIIPIIASMLPEVTYIPLKSDDNGSVSSGNVISNLSKYDVVSIGCGLTTANSVQEFVFKILSQIDKNQKLIIDADGINILSLAKSDFVIKNAVITPHPKELSRLLNTDINEIIENREKYARITAEKFDCITVLKGHNTIVTNGEKLYINQTGNSALAKAGTGDVLTGIISSLMAQKLNPFDAAKLGVFIHGLSGDIASSELTQYSVLASDVIEYIPFAIDEILVGD